ncbi:MAG: glycoside hydrolase family 99-like domain-containing protein [Candidatus Dactylopiibacterium sp.]|nr:glycoside hydrolase family 99-like domain-containing protein [Candidatus Dactylopiibacterium sp.]
MTQKTAILTNHSLRYFAGSELTTLEVARELRRRNWALHIACFELSPSVRELFDPLGVGWIDLNADSHPLEGSTVDLLWGHHFTTFDRLLADYRLRPEKTLFTSLSPYEPLECPPLYADHLSAVAANSIENFHEICRHGIDPQRVFVFENSVPDDDFAQAPAPHPAVPRKLAVISNHVPAEVLALREAAAGQLEIDFYGFEHQSVLITRERLAAYDLVLTIGRTVQQCLALEIPVYCYDRFGGPGYLDIYNFEQAAGYNFSGRCGHRKLDTAAILAELLEGYATAVAGLPTLKAIARQRFSISANVGKALDFIAPHDTRPLPDGLIATLARQGRYHARRLEALRPAPTQDDASPRSDFEEATRDLFAAPAPAPVPSEPSPAEAAVAPAPAADAFPVRAIAFYLPQFHRVRENDEWWGEGFTEWDNVRQGKPLFDGHYQPHEPVGLGYYDLDDVTVLSRQAEMARRFGLAGFCFYYYWFDGRRLLEKPVDQLLAHPEIDLPFCLNWANENWTRRWDGGESQVLMKQGYSPELDFRFAEDLARYFRDPRYIRVDGRPLVLVYRTDIIPEVEERARAWRQSWRALGIGEVYLVRVESFRLDHPTSLGFDAACEFFPHQIDFSAIAPFPFPQRLTDPEARIGDYDKLARQVESRLPVPYKRFAGIVPAWDNAARRRKGGATLFVNASPARYEKWLTQATERTMVEFEGDERLVFINAWNEWGEGCHLEPDARHGTAYLEATERALRSANAIDVVARRNFKPYQDWLARNSLPEDAVPATGDSLASVTLLIDTVRGDPATLATTLANAAALRARGARILCAGPAPCDDFPAWVEGNGVSPALLSQLAAEAPGGWFGVLRAGDGVSVAEFVAMMAGAARDAHAHVVYADEDRLDPVRGRFDPVLKPDHDPDHFASFDYIGRFALFRGSAWLEASPTAADAADGLFEVLLEQGTVPGRVRHHAGIVFHTHAGPAGRIDEGVRQGLLARHFAARGISAEVGPGLLPETFRVRYPDETAPPVSIIIPTRNQRGLLSRCIESLTGKTRYPNYELLIVDNGSDEAEAVEYLQGIANLGLDQIRVLSFPGPFNFSAMNNFAVGQARGEYLVLLNNDTAILKDDWLDALLEHARRPEVGAVGAKLLYPDGRIQHGGVVLGLRGPADHPFIGEAMGAPGYGGRLMLDQQYSAVTAACMMVRKAVYEAVGGMDETDFKVSYNDVDLCLKIRQAGLRIIWSPHAVVMHVGGVSQRTVDAATLEARQQRFAAEQRAMYVKWMPQLVRDPAYNPHLSLSGRGFELEGNPLCAAARPGQARLYALCADHYGSGFYRVIAPSSALMESGAAVGSCSRAYLEPVEVARAAPDAIILQRQITDGQLRYMRDYREFTNAQLVFELDDYLPGLPSRSVHKEGMLPNVQRNLRRAFDLCHRVVVSTDALRETLRGLHEDIVVLPNYLPVPTWSEIAPREAREPRARPRVGWAGGLGHTGDLRLIADVVRQLADQVDWVFFGLLPEGVSQYVAEYHPGVGIVDYPASLAGLDLDLALAPLEDNTFNECKSNLRLLEYGICAYPVIASDITPYRCGLPVTLVRNRHKDWVKAIQEKLSDRDALRREGLALQAAVRAQWMLEGDNLARWRQGWLGRRQP